MAKLPNKKANICLCKIKHIQSAKDVNTNYNKYVT